MDFPLMKKAIDDCSKMLVKSRVHFSGYGEPLLYPHIIETMKLCKQKGLKWSLTTNGYLLDKYSKDLIENRCNAINVSIHGGELEHDKISKIKDSFKKVEKGVIRLNEDKKVLKKSDPVIAINCVFNNNNIFSLKNILNMFLKLPINSITFQHIVFSEEDLEKSSDFIITDKEKLDKLREFVDYVNSNDSPIKVNFFPKIKTKDIGSYYTNKDYEFNDSCILPWLSVRVHPNGNITQCNQIFGNIKDSSLKSVINSDNAIKFRKLVRKRKFRIPDCFRCCHRRYY